MTNPRFTGIYGEGTDEAILRFSQTANVHENTNGLIPSVAIKLLMNGQKSENLFGMPSFLETGSWNFFENRLRSRVERFPEEPGTTPEDCMRRAKEEKMLEGHDTPYATSVVRPALMKNIIG